MTLGSGSHAESAMAAFARRQGQLDTWRESDTAKESTDIRNRPKRVKFADKCIFQAACASNDKGQVARMIHDGYDINAVDEDGITALHQACIDDNFEMVEFLLDNGADVNISDNEGWTPLHAVASCCYVSITKLLLENGANVVALNNDCCIPLDICKSEEIKELFKQDINSKGIDLNEARHGEEIKMMEDAKRWISTGVYQEEPHPTTGATGLHVAACKGYIKVLDLLIKASANINSRDVDGWTPLHAAAHWGQKEACEVLLENMCDMNIKNNCDQTALDVADDSVVPILEDFKKKHDVNKNIESIGKQSNILPLPPRQKPPKADFDDTLTIVTNQSGHSRLPETSNSGSEEEDETNEAADTVGDLPYSDTSVPAEFPTINNIYSNENDDISDVIISSDSDAPSRIEDSPKSKAQEREIDHSIVPGRASPSSSIPLVSGTPQTIESPTLKSNVEAAVDDSIPAWRRGGSLRTRTNASPVEEKTTDRVAVRRTRSEASTGSDASLRRAYSFESDSKFYTRLTSARNRIKAIEAASAAMTANLLDPTLISNHDASLMSSSLTNQNNPPLPAHNSLDVILRRKPDTDTPRSPRPTTISTSTPQRPTGAVTSNPSVQMRSGDNGGISPPTPTTPGGTKIGPVSKFKQFLFKSFVPPARDEESETQRKAHAKRVRETRRSTQGVTLEELKSAEQYVKNSQHGNATTASSETAPQFSITSVPANVSTVLRKDEEQSLERRPSWRLRVDDSDRNKFSLEDTRNPISRPTTGSSGNSGIGHSSDNIMTVQRSPITRRSNKTESSPIGRPPRPPHEDRESQLEDEKDKEMKNSGAQGAILRKKKQKRRSTGVVQYNADGADPDRQDNAVSDTEVGSGKGSELSNDYDQTGADSTRSENGVSSRINYRKLYEEILKENQLLKSRLTRYEEEVSDLKTKLDKVSQATPRIGADESEKREKRALELKMEAMELELREVRHLKSENQKIRDENGALIRVISKLSK